MAFKNLSTLRTLVRQKADIENDGNHVSDSEIDTYINSGIEVLHSLLVDGTDGSLFAKNAGVLLKLGDFAYQLPADFSQLVDVSVYTGNHYYRSDSADPQDYARLATENYKSTDGTQHYLQWNIEQGRAELFIFPEPNNTADIAVRYVAEPPVLSLDTDTLNFPTFWYQWVVYDAAVQVANKEESDPQALMIERDKIEKRVRDHIRSMTITQIKTIRRTRDSRHSRLIPPSIYRSS